MTPNVADLCNRGIGGDKDYNYNNSAENGDDIE
jgi:hypothetical protein